MGYQYVGIGVSCNPQPLGNKIGSKEIDKSAIFRTRWSYFTNILVTNVLASITFPLRFFSFR